MMFSDVLMISMSLNKNGLKSEGTQWDFVRGGYWLGVVMVAFIALKNGEDEQYRIKMDG